MNYLQNIFSNRELALIIWGLAIIVLVLFFKPFRRFIVDALKILSGRTILVILILMVLYLMSVFVFLKIINFWHLSDLKDSVLWLFTVAFVMLFKSVDIKQTSHFKLYFLESIKITAFLVFIINFYSFNLIIELVILPIIAIVITTQAYAESDKENLIVSDFLTKILGLIGLLFVVYSIYRTIIEPSKLLDLNTLKAFLFPIVLTILFIPYIYFLSLYNMYVTFFNRLKYMYTDKKTKKTVRKRILLIANLNLNSLNNITSNFKEDFLINGENLNQYLINISKEKASG